MSIDASEIARQARHLSPEDRSRLIEILLGSLKESPLAEIEAAWNKEIADRAASYDRGETKSYAAEEVFAEARRLIS